MSERRIRLSQKDLETGKVHDGPTHCFHCGARLPEPELPTTVPPGTNERIRVMMARAERGMPLTDPRDYDPDSKTDVA